MVKKKILITKHVHQPKHVKVSEKEKNDRVIVLQAGDFNGIPGSIRKDVREYINQNSSFNQLINISIQVPTGKTRNLTFDHNTTIALKNHIMHEMVSY